MTSPSVPTATAARPMARAWPRAIGPRAVDDRPQPPLLQPEGDGEEPAHRRVQAVKGAQRRQREPGPEGVQCRHDVPPVSGAVAADVPVWLDGDRPSQTTRTAVYG